MVPNGLFNRVARNPSLMAGRPFLKGTYLTVDYIRGRVARGATIEDLLREHGELVADDVLACLMYPVEPEPASEIAQPDVFDLGHQEDVDYTQIRQMLSLTPDERLERHEGWRLFVKEALHLRAALGLQQQRERPGDAPPAGP